MAVGWRCHLEFASSLRDKGPVSASVSWRQEWRRSFYPFKFNLKIAWKLQEQEAEAQGFTGNCLPSGFELLTHLFVQLCATCWVFGFFFVFFFVSVQLETGANTDTKAGSRLGSRSRSPRCSCHATSGWSKHEPRQQNGWPAIASRGSS